MTAPTALPFGMRDLKISPYSDAGGMTLGSTSIDLPNMQTLSFSETEDYTELRGDDKVIAIRGQGSLVEWELEAGGLNLAAWEVLTGGTVILTGITPNRKWVLRKRSTQTRPYFRIEGRMISDSGGDVHCVIYRCRANDTIEGEFADGEFFITSASGQGLPLIVDEMNDLIYDMVINETAVLIPSTPAANPTLQDAPTGLGGGAPAATTVPLTWTAATVGPPSATEYDVWMRVAFGDWTQVAGANLTSRTTTGATVTGLVTATQYQFRVRAVTAANGTSDFTAPISRTTA
jgi:hypothetical protein